MIFGKYSVYPLASARGRSQIRYAQAIGLRDTKGRALNPPYERTGENAYRISVAVAGFTDADLSIEAQRTG
jgi:HSP20 family molecular chaperone IbpA